MRTLLNNFVATILANDSEPEDHWYVHGITNFQEMAVVIDAVVGAMATLGYQPKDIFGARLVLEEAVCNAIKHGHQYDPAKVVEVGYCIRDDHFLVEVKDQGAGFDASAVPDATTPENLERPCGRGLLLMRYYAAWVRYNRKGNCLRFCICPSETLTQQQAGAPLLAVVD